MSATRNNDDINNNRHEKNDAAGFQERRNKPDMPAKDEREDLLRRQKQLND